MNNNLKLNSVTSGNYFYFTATLRSGYMLQDTAEFAQSVETLLRKTLNISPDEKVRAYCSLQ